MTEIRAIGGGVERDERARQFIEDAALLSDDAQESSKVIGYVMVALYSDGATRSAGYRPSTEEHAMGSALWEAWCRAALEGHFMFREGVDAAHAVLNGEA